ncbi:exported hypothetical protein [metagenome]|uniref:Uncharacterized protein n=1 Tax=metagenome TaxID=256318 RepID=A0A2P2BXW6_9ZZZZ
MRSVLAGAAASLVLLSAPTAAFAVAVSSSQGKGAQLVAEWHPCGLDTGGFLKSLTGKPVYFAGMTTWKDLIPDENIGRYTDDITSSEYKTNKGLIGTGSSCAYRGSFTGVKVRVCRNLSHLPDPCGSWVAIRK